MRERVLSDFLRLCGARSDDGCAAGKMEKDLLKTMEEGMPRFSKGQKQIAAYITAHYEKAAFMTASKLGGLVGVSESTVVRFADELGYDGYPELQKALQELVRTKLTSFQRVEVASTQISEENLLEKVLLSDAEKIYRTLEATDRTAFDRAVEKIVTARRIFIIGVRSSSYLAGFLYHNLRIIFDNVELVQADMGNEIFEHILTVGPEDVLIAITFPRYSKRTIRAVTYAKQHGANVIALTDSVASPIAEFADEFLLSQSDMASFVDSLVAPLSIINAMIVAVSMKKKDELDARLRKLEGIWKAYDVYAYDASGENAESADKKEKV